MNKTILRNIHLVNWYGFSNRTIPVSENLTLISGENECGNCDCHAYSKAEKMLKSNNFEKQVTVAW